MIDTHCHLYDKKLYTNLDEIIANASEANINKMICIGDNLITSEQSIQLSEKYPNIYATIGIHPHEAKNAPENYLDIIKQKNEHNKVVAIGEIGLDYHYNFSAPNIQKKIFLEQLKLAKTLNLPAVIHCRDSYEDLYEIILKSKNTKGVIHCFSGNLEFAHKIIELGYYISFTGMITFVKELEHIIKNVDLKHILVETDSPYLAPIPYRGKVNQPAYVNKVAEKIADIKNISIQEVDTVTSNNASLLFNKLSN
tara:strand:- start:3309 stop:4067 length:759 start_codon:yes stop_codon:yes gene_type:complete